VEENNTLRTLRNATRGTPFENRLFLVGGYVRDKLLYGDGVAAGDDIDLVLEGDALAVARLLFDKRAADHLPVEYGRFGTTQVTIGGAKVELVTARAETYRQGSRKPIVRPGTLQTDAERRDFTINTLLENLHTGEIHDPLGKGRADLSARVLRTPLDPRVTFAEDPLRMLRACRFTAKLGFKIADETAAALTSCAPLCNPEHGVSYERIREELNKTLLTTRSPLGLEMMRASGLLAQFAPELSALHGTSQNHWHRFDVWTHTLNALENLPPDASLLVRLATLFHDIGKPATRTLDLETGDAHFYGHADAGAQITRTVLNRLRYSVDEIKTVVRLVALHMRYGDYDPAVWTDKTIRRLLREVGDLRGDLFTLARADARAVNPPDPPRTDFDGLQARMETIEANAHVTQATSPLDGQALIALLGTAPGPLIGKIKNALTDAVVSGDLAPDDLAGAEQMAAELFRRLQQPEAPRALLEQKGEHGESAAARYTSG
jgi:poly(A) polymerase